MSGSLKMIFLLILFCPSVLKSQEITGGYAESSVLASGKWFRMAVTTDAVYKIDYSTLRNLGFDNPKNTRIYGNNCGQLSYYNNDASPDDLEEIAVCLNTGADGVFNEGDYLLFYAQGTGRWKYDPEKDEYGYLRHNYSDTAYYFITSSSQPGHKIESAEMPSSGPGYFSDTSDALWIHEEEDDNLLKSGREWYQPVSQLVPVAFIPGFSPILASEPVKYRIRALARASGISVFRFYEGNEKLADIYAEGVEISSTTGTYARIVEATGRSLPRSASPSYELRFFNNGDVSAKGWVDYIVLQGRKRNNFTGSALFITDSRSVAHQQITEFTVNSTIERTIIWDVTNPVQPSVINANRNGNNLSFTATTDTLKTFIAFTPDRVPVPLIDNIPVSNQDLHASEPAEMIILTHPGFKNHAMKLSELHFSNSSLVSLVVTPEQVYNEFSGGIPDICAIRNFVRMKYLKQAGSSKPLKYLLLFGDGSYDNKTKPPLNPCFIPTYQSKNSNVIISSFTSDDFYGLLEEGEGEDQGTLDIGVGRLPVSDTTEAGIILRKIERYMSPAVNGAWKNIVTLIADDEDGNIHMNDAEGLARLLNDSVPEINVKKIYFDAFRQVTMSGGQLYPDATRALNEVIHDGSLIVNYTGHGNELSLGHEQVVTTETIRQWKNSSRLPLFITATCEFSRFDDAEFNPLTNERKGKKSAGEIILLSKDGGGIALMSTTRLAYSAPNYSLNYNIMNVAFDRDSEGNSLGFGDIIRIAKNRTESGVNKRNFALLGDPALKLALPLTGKIVTDSINGKPASETNDTLRALSIVTIAGHVEKIPGITAEDFNGILETLVFDKPLKTKSLANDGGVPMEFYLPGNILFSGETKVSQGRFSFRFIVPRDIDYNMGRGKISYYAYDETSGINGYYDKIIAGGFSEITAADTSGPDIRLFLNDTLFRNGGMTDPDPVLLALISDPAGINTAGSGIGHDITFWIDNDRSSSYTLNHLFNNDFDSYNKGRITYRLSGLSAGHHTITLKAWDNFNNSSEKTISFVVESSDRFILKNVRNYPNPFTDNTYFTAEHNRPGKEADVTVTIFNLNGAVVKTLTMHVCPPGFILPPLEWNGRDSGNNRMARGIYPYRITVNNQDGETNSIPGRLIIY